MDLRSLLQERRTALCERWLDAVLAEYGELTATRWRKERDPFANPVGFELSKGLPRILDAVLDGAEPAPAAVKALEALVKIRSIQDFTPSRAVGFVALLRGAIRDELGKELAEGAGREALALIEGRIERLTYLAFDMYVRTREQLHRIRQDELRRSVASILRRWHGEDPDDASLVRLSAPGTPGARR
jgi:hypothetical protein